jgi:hypothetical protein
MTVIKITLTPPGPLFSQTQKGGDFLTGTAE